jgi:hypothetical protein
LSTVFHTKIESFTREEMETGDTKLKNRGEKVLSYLKKQSEGVGVQWEGEG